MIVAKFDEKAAKEIGAKLGRLDRRFAVNAMRRALRSGANVIRDAARNNAKRYDDAKTPNKIYKNIVTVAGKSRDQNAIKMRVGVLGGARQTETAKAARRRVRSGSQSLESLGELSGKGKANPGGDTWYWRLLEFGTSRTAAKPFMRSAMESKADDALNVAFGDMTVQLDKELSK